jgi:hypothetical protein
VGIVQCITKVRRLILRICLVKCLDCHSDYWGSIPDTDRALSSIIFEMLTSLCCINIGGCQDFWYSSYYAQLNTACPKPNHFPSSG